MSRHKKQAGNTLGHVLLFAGPHGAGKDTLAAQFSSMQPDVARIVRHITRPAARDEVNGRDYYFIDESTFLDMVAQTAFIEHARYIGVMSGTSYAEIYQKLQQAKFANLTSNFEDGLNLYRALGSIGISRVCFFISPVSETTLRDDPDEYIGSLRRRMVNRGRPHDLIEGRLIKAAAYRELYLANEGDVVYIDNSDGSLEEAGRIITQTALALAANSADEEPV